MKNPMDRSLRSVGRFKYLLLAAVIMTYLLIVMGGIVRVTGSGLGCPDWPTCFGKWIPPMRADAIIEYLHRLAAAITSPLILGSVVVGWIRYKDRKLLSRPLIAAAALLVVQALLGGIVVILETPPNLVAIHLSVALVILGLLLVPLVIAFSNMNPAFKDRLQFKSKFGKQSLIILALLFLTLISGAVVASTGATYSCVGWPLCGGQLFPVNPLGWVHMFHRLLVLVVGVLVITLLNRAWRSQRDRVGILTAATSFGVLYYAQVLIGALKVTRDFATYLLGLHVATAAAVWAMGVVLVVLVGIEHIDPVKEVEAMSQPINSKQRTKDLLSLTKPIIVALLLVTTYTGMVVGGKAFPPFWITFWTMLAGAMAAGGSGAVNQYIDREIDQFMTRTAKRPIASGRMTPAEGLAFGAGILLISFYLMAGFVNLLAALLSLTGMIYYVLIYSIFLKKTTVQNIVIGGGAGAIPPLVGWAAVTGTLNIPSLFLFAIIFMWTPPHFWALALVREKEYARAGIPMMPVVKGRRETRWLIFLYTIELVILTLLMPVLGMAGGIYFIMAALLGLGLIYYAWLVWRRGGNKLAWRMYRYSSVYLALLFAALMIDSVI